MIALLVLLDPASAAPPAVIRVSDPLVGVGHPSSKWWTETLLILGVDAAGTKVAYKRIGRAELDPSVEQEAVDCGYAGMKDLPTRGVELGVYDLTTKKVVDSQAVYEAVIDRAKCTSQAVSEERLAAAKALFGTHGIDIATPTPPKPIADFGLTAQTGRELHEEDMSYTGTAALSRAGAEVYERTVQYRAHMGQNVLITFPSAWKVGGQLVVVECHHDSGMRWDSQACAFTSLPL